MSLPTNNKEQDQTGSLAKPFDSEGTNALWRIGDWFPKLDPGAAKVLQAYHQELLKFNGKVNLISRNTEREADEIHFADCIFAHQALCLAGKLGKAVYDLGAGNGFPGIVFAVLSPDTEFFLIEGDVRKCEFLRHCAHSLGLRNVKVENSRLETLKGTEMRVAVSRGFASISKTCLLCNRIMPGGGQLYHLKGTNWSSEVGEMPSQVIASWALNLVGEYVLPVSQARRAIVCTTKK